MSSNHEATRIHARLLEKLAQNQAVGSKYINVQKLDQGPLAQYEPSEILVSLRELLDWRLVRRHGKHGNLRKDVVSIVATNVDRAADICETHLPEEAATRAVARLRSPGDDTLNLGDDADTGPSPDDDDSRRNDSTPPGEYVPRPLFEHHLERLHDRIAALDGQLAEAHDRVESLQKRQDAASKSRIQKLEDQVQEIEDRLDNLANQVQSLTEPVENRLDELEKYLNTRNRRIRSRFEELDRGIEATFEELPSDEARSRVAATARGCYGCDKTGDFEWEALERYRAAGDRLVPRTPSPVSVCKECRPAEATMIVSLPDDPVDRERVHAIFKLIDEKLEGDERAIIRTWSVQQTDLLRRYLASRIEEEDTDGVSVNSYIQGPGIDSEEG